MLNEPGTSPYDLHFNLFGIPVRISWTFWLMAAVLGWGWSQSIDGLAVMVEMESPGPAVLLLVWAAGVFLSILVHELGHSLAMRYYGISSRIVLYHFGGLAIPDSFGSWNGARRRNLGARENIIISAAGPAIQILLGLLFWLIAMKMGIFLHEVQFLNNLIQLEQVGEYPSSAVVYGFFGAVILPSIYWAILNLAPILPLDGGQIMRNVLYLIKAPQPTRNAYLVSVVTAGAIGLWFLSTGEPFGIMFLLFAASNWQLMQQSGGPF